MLIIGLIGGSEENRDQIADQICSVSPHITRFDMRYPKNPADRAKQLRNLVVSHGVGFGKTLVLPTILTELEAETLRELGALFAVVKGQVSNTVPIRVGDLYVTNSNRHCRHFLTPEEMYSEAKQIHNKKQRAARDRGYTKKRTYIAAI